jgi:uncharacterized Zn-binding protein involved in type VI secretion
MPAVSRVGDTSTGHGCFPPTTMTSSPVQKTFINGSKPGVVDSTCKFSAHSCGTTTHPDGARTPTAGTSKTKIEGYSVARIADPLGCGDIIGEGSPNTFME